MFYPKKIKKKINNTKCQQMDDTLPKFTFHDTKQQAGRNLKHCEKENR